MKAYCLVPELADKLMTAVKQGDVVGDMEKLYTMSSEERRAAFGKFLDKDNAREVNTAFEKAMISSQKDALANWVKGTFTGKAKEEKRVKTALDTIAELDDLLTPENEKEFLEDLVAQKLGIHVTAEQGAKISKLAGEIEEAKGKFKGLGNPDDNPDAQITYLEKKREVEDYLKSLNPSSKLAIATSTIGRGNLLLRVSSTLINLESNLVQGSFTAIERRMETRQLKGANSGYANKVRSFYIKVYNKTGYDMTRTTTLDDAKNVTLGEKQRVHSEGKGVIRKIGRWYEDKVFGLTQGLPDVMSAALAHVDRADIEATKLAKLSGLKGKFANEKAKEILQDALLLEPQTDAGKLVRQTAIADAAYSTLQHKTLFSEKALALREILNIKDFKFGDMQVPFVKTPANAIAVAIADRSGIMVPVRAVTNTIKAVKLIQGEQSMLQLVQSRRPDMAPKQAIQSAFRGYSRTIIRGGMGVTTAFMLANALDPDDFIGEYPVNENERKLIELGNATPNSIKVAGHWISTDYLTAMAAPFIGFMYAKKYGNNPQKYIEAYLRGTLYQTVNVPGLTEVRDLIGGVAALLPNDKLNTESAMQELYHYAAGFGTARFIPGIVSQINSAFDKKRDTKVDGDPYADIKAQIPGLRQQLPEKKTIFGESMDGEGWAQLLFGARAKTAKDDPVVNELMRLSQSGNIPTLNDVRQKSDKAKQLKEQIGDAEFNAFFADFGTAWKEGIGELIEDQEYLDATDENKKDMLNDLKRSTFNEWLDIYGYEEPEKEE